MSKRIANSRSKSKARNGRVRLGFYTRRRANQMQTQLDSVYAEKRRLENLPSPGVLARATNRINRFFRRGVR